MKTKKLQQGRLKRAERVRYSLKMSSSKPRVSVYRSSKHIYAQLINDQEHKTIVSAGSLKLETKDLDKTAVAKLVGIELAKKALEAKIDEACFDRGRYLYHGRVKSLADGLREGGLKI